MKKRNGGGTVRGRNKKKKENKNIGNNFKGYLKILFIFFYDGYLTSNLNPIHWSFKRFC